MSPILPVSHNLVKPASELTKPVQREEHLYDVPRYYREEGVFDYKATDASTEIGKESSTADLLSSNSGEHNRPTKSSSKLGQKGSGVLEDHARLPLVVAEDGGRGSVSVKGGNKERQNVLTWLIGRKSRSGSSTTEEKAEPSRSKSKKKKKGRRKSGKGSALEQEQAHLSDETDEFVHNGMYENLEEAKLKKTAYSASCDNLLESCSMTDSHSALTSGPSSVPQPSPGGGSYSTTVPSSGSVPQPRLRESTSLSEDSPINMYQNLQELASDKEAQASPIAPPTDTPSPLYSNVKLSSMPEKEPQATPISPPSENPFYSNVQLSSVPGKDPPPPKQTSYAVVDILSHPVKARRPLKTKIQKQSSLTSIMMEPKRAPTVSNRMRSQSTLHSPDSNPGGIGSGDGGVVYAPLDFMAMSAVAQIREEHRDIRNFEGLLKRHDVREMEMEEQRRRKFNIT